jgi:hypothetical protein
MRNRLTPRRSAGLASPPSSPIDGANAYGFGALTEQGGCQKETFAATARDFSPGVSKNSLNLRKNLSHEFLAPCVGKNFRA